MDGVKFGITNLGSDDSIERIKSLMVGMGGAFSLHADQNTTHIIARHGTNDADLIAFVTNNSTLFITFEWVLDSFQKNMKCDEFMYQVAQSTNDLERLVVALTEKKLRSPHPSLDELFPNAASVCSCLRGIVDDTKLNSIMSQLCEGSEFDPVKMASVMVNKVKSSVTSTSHTVRVNNGRPSWKQPNAIELLLRMLQTSPGYVSAQAVCLKQCQVDHSEPVLSTAFDGAGTDDDILLQMNSIGQLNLLYSQLNNAKDALCFNGEIIWDANLNTLIHTGVMPTKGSVAELRMINYQVVSVMCIKSLVMVIAN